MSGERLPEYLERMRLAARQACAFVNDMDEETFLRDVRTQMAVGMALVLIGEAASRIIADHAEFKDEHPDIPWGRIRGMRNLVAHDYYEVELPIVLSTARTALPDLITQLDAIIDWRAKGE